MTYDFNKQPYFDDFSEENHFYKILFKPSLAVQARELNQLQTIISKQIEVYGKHVFKQGSVVIPGGTSIDNDIMYVKLSGTPTTSSLIGLEIRGQSSGVIAKIIHATDVDGADPATLFVRYLSSGTSNTQKTFIDNEVLLNNLTSATLVSTAAISCSGNASISSIEAGWYFIKNHFVKVESQTIVLDKYSNTPSYKIGLDAIEDISTSDEDEALLDNAQGYPNFAAPGADRYNITLTYTKKSIDSTTNEEDFIQLIVVKDGVVQQKIDNSQYSILEKTLARRTYDESGDYTVRPFQIDVREYRNNFRGAWVENTVYLANDVVTNGGNYYQARKDGTSNSTPPTHTLGSSSSATTGVVWTYEKSPFFNRGVYDVASGETLTQQNNNKDKLAVGLEPGKAYVKGYEIEKIATEYIPVSKARTSLQQTNLKVVSTVGNYILATNVYWGPDITTLPLVTIYDRYTTTRGSAPASGVAIGTCRVRYIEYHDGTAGATTARYKLSVFDISMNTGYSFNRDAKQLFWNDSSNSINFTCDISPQLIQISGSIASSGTTVSGTGTLFLTELKIGDWITSNGQVRRVTAIASNISLTTDSAFSPVMAGSVLYRHETSIIEPEYEALLYQLPYPYIKSVRDASGVNDTSYTIYNKFQQTAILGSGNSTISISVSGTDTFASPLLTGNYLVFNRTTGDVVVPTSITLSTSQLAVITIPTTTLYNYVVIAAVNSSGSLTEKTKTLTTTTTTISTKNAATATEVKLGKADGYRLLAVFQDTGTFSSPTGVYTTDITDRFRFNDGQKISHYDLCSIVLKSGYQAPTSPIQVTFEYFEHTGSGDHFTVNSYLSSISYDEIPYFQNVSLADVFDFRPRISDAGTTFTGNSGILRRGIDITADFQHYIGRVDKLILNQDGSFFNQGGVPDLNPQEPTDTSTGMVLYKLRVLPYTNSTYSVNVEFVDNKRYTMRDIGKLEKRLSNVEYYTSLSMLEQNAQSLEIQDEFGLNRFKNGFIVDNFTGHNIGDITSLDYNCSIDMEYGELRPFFYMDNVKFVEENSSTTQRVLDGYTVTGDLITLPYTEVEMIAQLDASRTENINPFAIFTFIGSMTLNPPSDEWFETNRLPDIINNVEGNFNSVYATLERQGVLGTVWNAWQTQWTGSTQVSRTTYTSVPTWGTPRTGTNLTREQINAMFGASSITSSIGLVRDVTVETSAQTGIQSRTGIRTVVVPKITTEVTSDRTVSKAVIPYIRSRLLMFVVRGVKPSTLFTPFFDSLNVDAYVKPASIITIAKNTLFDSESSAGGNAAESARMLDGVVEAGLDKGDVIYVSKRGATTYTKTTSPATAVLGLNETGLNGTTSKLHIVNIKGSGAFLVGDEITGTISGQVATITIAPTTKAYGDDLISSEFGSVVGVFRIPNTEALRFRTGIREFKLTDSSTNSSERTSFTTKQYRAEGILETKQATITATRNAEVIQEVVNESKTVVQEVTRVISDTGWIDPLAQTFMVDSNGGAFITSVDIWFASKDATIPVRLEIREVVNGYPGKLILPFSQVVVDARDVNLSSTTVKTSTGAVYPAPTVATNFKFKSPVYLNNKTEYCIVLLSDSNNYNVWITQLGDTSVTSGRTISEQPYAGVLFKSQNASTWTADQNQDLMFKINKAKFVVGQYGECDFVNTSIPTFTLGTNPLQTVSGTNYVRVTHENHCMFAGSKVTISGVDNAGGIPIGQLNATHTILADSLEYDSYLIQVASNATASGNFGGLSVVATENIQFTTIQPIIQQQIFPDTEMIHFYQGRSGKSPDGNETPYVKDSTFYSVTANENNRLNIINIIGNTATEADFMSGEKSVKMRSRMISYNENVSPVVDTARLSLVTIQDKINSPTQSTVNFAALDSRSVVSANTLVSVSTTSRFATADATTRLAFLTVDVGQHITTSGFASGSNNGTFLVTGVASDGSYIEVSGTLVVVAAGASVTITALDRFLDEISPIGSSSVAKYSSKKINLDLPSEFIKVKFAADVEEAANIALYYKTNASGTSTPFNKIPYTLANPTRSIVRSNDGVFYDVEYNLTGLQPFTAVQVKLVMTSTYNADIVRVKDLTIICCA